MFPDMMGIIKLVIMGMLNHKDGLKRNPVKSWLGKRGEKHNKSIGVIAYNTITNEKTKYGSMRIAEEKTSISRVTIRKYINKNKPYKNILFYESKNNNS